MWVFCFTSSRLGGFRGGKKRKINTIHCMLGKKKKRKYHQTRGYSAKYVKRLKYAIYVISYLESVRHKRTNIYIDYSIIFICIYSIIITVQNPSPGYKVIFIVCNIIGGIKNEHIFQQSARVQDVRKTIKRCSSLYLLCVCIQNILSRVPPVKSMIRYY